MSYLFGETLLMTEYLVFSDVTSRSIRRLHHRPSPGSRLGRHLEQIRLLAVNLRRQLHLGMTKKGSKYPSTEYHRPKKTTIRYVYIRIYIYITYLYTYLFIYVFTYVFTYVYVHAYNLSFRSSQPRCSRIHRHPTSNEFKLRKKHIYYHPLETIIIFYHLFLSTTIYYHL